MAQEEYDRIANEVDTYEVGARTRSAAQLAWFLSKAWRLDPDQVEDSICDGPGDKGIDGLILDRETSEIVVLQSYHADSPTNTQGSAKLQQFRGVADYFSSPDAIDTLLASGPNDELKKLLSRLRVRELLDESAGWTVRLVYVTNAEPDASATGYLTANAPNEPPLELWDQARLAAVARRTEIPGFVEEEIRLTLSASFERDLGDGRLLVAGLAAGPELAALPGIEDFSVFGLNVRLSLGRTRINRELQNSVKNAQEHHLFPAFHNGLTLLTHRLDYNGDGPVTLEGVSVVNGCQSLMSLFESRTALTDQLEILVKIIQLGDDPELAGEITYRSNNQNPVNYRDQRSTDAVQRDLQAGVTAAYPDQLFYKIRQGEQTPPHVPVLDNVRAAQLLRAVYNGEPHRAVRAVSLFDSEYHDVFTVHVDAHRLYLLYLLDQAIEAKRGGLRADLASSFASVRYTVARIVREVVELSPLGARLFTDPQPWLSGDLPEVQAELERFTQDVVDSLNFHVEEEETEASERGETYDPKVAFKSERGVRALSQRAVKDAERAARRDESRGETYLFAVEPTG